MSAWGELTGYTLSTPCFIILRPPLGRPQAKTQSRTNVLDVNSSWPSPRNQAPALRLGCLPSTASSASLHPPETHGMVSLHRKTCHGQDKKEFKDNWLQVCKKCKIITLNCHKNWSGLATPSHLERVSVLFVRKGCLLRRTTIKHPLKWHVRFSRII